MTSDALKAFLSTPVALFILMNIASITQALKAVIAARQQGSTVSFWQYLTAFWPQNLASIAGNVIAFVVLILTDQLNFASALGIGYGVNSVSDLLQPRDGRTAAITNSTGGDAPEPKR